jgi:hypothetical protein
VNVPDSSEVGFIFSIHGWVVIVHGIVLGGLFVAALAATLAALLVYRAEILTAAGQVRCLRLLKSAGVASLAAGWATVLLGTFVVDPYFHGGNDPPAHILESYSGTLRWVTWAMPGKEDAALMSVILTSVAVVAILAMGPGLLERGPARTLLAWFLAVALSLAGMAALLGAGLAKVGPIV